MSKIIDLHHDIIFYLIIILTVVLVIIFEIKNNFEVDNVSVKRVSFEHHEKLEQ
jgi:hypothetical protein